jgi:hypothetical protein
MSFYMPGSPGSDRRPGGWCWHRALALAIHAHPSTAGLVLVVIAVGVCCATSASPALGCGVTLVAALPFAPLAIDTERHRRRTAVWSRIWASKTSRTFRFLRNTDPGPRVIARMHFCVVTRRFLAVEGAILSSSAGVGLMPRSAFIAGWSWQDLA